MSTPTSFQRVLIANRGEIAWRILRTLHKMGLEGVSVYSAEDRYTSVVQYANSSIEIYHKNKLAYLDIEQILDVAHQQNCQAIHPGYGFLSENEEFATACQQKGIIFIGPRPETIRLFGNKSSAKELAQQSQVPCLDGFSAIGLSEEEMVVKANALGFPLLLKAAHGGGGRGIRQVNNANELLASIKTAKQEALIGFGKDELLVEKFLPHSRHIEFQILADSHGNQIHLGERDCSLQRRNQKIIEETPANISESLRQKMASAALRIAKNSNYLNAGTVEFLVSDKNDFYFLEVNPRLQVEHPITEQVTGLDLVELQIKIAQGLPLPVQQKEITFLGHAIELRINCEDPGQGFAPDSGLIHQVTLPNLPDVRVDHWIHAHTMVSNQFDNLLAKIILHHKSRKGAIELAKQSLERLKILGVSTNKNFLSALLQADVFQKQISTTDFINTFVLPQMASPVSPASLASLCLIYQKLPPLSYPLISWQSGTLNSYLFESSESAEKLHYQIVAEKDSYTIHMNDQVYNIKPVDSTQFLLATSTTQHAVVYHLTQEECHVDIDGFSMRIPLRLQSQNHSSTSNKASILSPMTGKLTQVYFKKGDSVKRDQELFVVEAMKMQISVRSPIDGTLVELMSSLGAQVKNRQHLATLQKSEES